MTLGVIQGLTEFLPVSSSGHLVIAQSFIPNFHQPGVLFDALLHFGTLLAVVVYFRNALFSLDKKMLGLLALGTVPAGLVGFLFKDSIEVLFSSTMVVGLALLFTGAMNWLVDSEELKTKNEKRVGWIDAIVVGLFQAMALVPGISRSGSTIFAGVFRGIDRKTAATFSFLLSVPAVFGAVSLEVFNYGVQGLDFVYIPGILAAFAIGYASIGVLMRFLLERRFRIFAVYCFAAGILTLLFGFWLS